MTKSSCCTKMPKMTSSSRWANANSMNYHNYTINNTLTMGSGVAAKSRFVQSAHRRLANTVNNCNMFRLNQLSNAHMTPSKC